MRIASCEVHRPADLEVVEAELRAAAEARLEEAGPDQDLVGIPIGWVRP